MKRLALAVATLSAAVAAPALAQPRTPAEAIVRALDVLCVAPPGRETSMAEGFEYWGAFSEFAAADGDLEVRPGRACGLTYRGTEAGAHAISEALDRWADRRGMGAPAMVRMDRQVRYGNGDLQWTLIPSAAANTGIIEIVYRPPNI